MLFTAFMSITIITNAQSGQKIKNDELDQFLRMEMQKEQVPGLAYAVLLNGKLVGSGVYGLADVELKSPVSISTVFPIGSIGKTFTATAIMLLQQQGKLKIDDPINKYFDSLPATWNKITIRNLLSHTSGIRDYLNNFPGYVAIDEDNARQEITPADFLKMMKKYPLNFQPGERFSYCNAGFVLLGFIVQKVSGVSLPGFLQQNVFGPLGMNETSYVNNEKLTQNRASGYSINESGLLENGMYISDFYSSLGDMGVMTSISDMIKWSKALNEGRIVTKSMLENMWKPSLLTNGTKATGIFGNYGLGWSIENYRGYELIGHNGVFGAGFSADFLEFPDKKLNVIVLSNLDRTRTRWISCHIAGSVLPELKGLDQLPVTNSGSAYLQKASSFFKWLNRENADSDIVTKQYSRSINPMMKIIFNHPANVELSLTFVSCDTLNHPLKSDDVPIKKIAYYKINVMNEDHYLALYFTADNRVANVMGY